MFGSKEKQKIDYESLSREDRKIYEMHKYLWRKGRARTQGRKTSQQLQNGVPCKLDVRGNAILDPLTQPINPKKKEDEVDPASID